MPASVVWPSFRVNLARAALLDFPGFAVRDGTAKSELGATAALAASAALGSPLQEVRPLCQEHAEEGPNRARNVLAMLILQ
jgi:hypothetical protein